MNNRRRITAGIAAIVFVVVVGGFAISQALAPSNAEIVRRAVAAGDVWRQRGAITRFSTVTRQTGAGAGSEESVRREFWVSYDGESQRQTMTRVGTPQTFASIWEPDSLRDNNVVEETSATALSNGRYTARQVETPQGQWILIERTPASRHDVWWGPCGSCHAPKLNAEKLAAQAAGLPPYLSRMNEGALRVVGKGKVGGHRTYTLRAERPSIPAGYSEVTTIDVDRKTYLPLRYRIDTVQDLGNAGREVVDSVSTDITSHRVIDRADASSPLFEIALPDDAAWVARESFDPSSTAIWPPQGAVSTETTVPRVYDLGTGYPIVGGRMTGTRMSSFSSKSGTSSAEATGRPDAVVEALHPDPEIAPSIRVLAEYGELTPAGSRPVFGSGDLKLANGSTYSRLLWVITLPPVERGMLEQWTQGATVTTFTAGGRQALEVRGATIEDSTRPFDYEAAIVSMPDATVVITQPPNTRDNPRMVRDAVGHLVRRQ